MPHNRFGAVNSVIFQPFPPFFLILQVLKKASYDQTEQMFIVTPIWQSQIGHLLLLEMSIVCPLLLTRSARLIKPQEEVHLRSSSSNFKQKITTSGVDHIWERLLKKGISETVAQQVQDGKLHSQIKIRPGECGLAGMINNRLMHFDVM